MNDLQNQKTKLNQASAELSNAWILKLWLVLFSLDFFLGLIIQLIQHERRAFEYDILYSGCPSDIYPTATINKFMSSIKKVDIK